MPDERKRYIYGAGPYLARPLLPPELVPEEEHLLEAIKEKLREMGKPAGPGSGPTPNPWALVQDDPRSRVIAIDGERGTGKTSLMLTLIDRLGEPQGATQAHPPPEIRCLQPLDFDPIPDGMPIHAWLIQAFLPVVKHLQAHPTWCSSDPRRAGVEGGLRDRWTKVLERATSGWASIDDSRGLPDRVLDHRDQLRDYFDLVPDWRGFVDALFKELEGCGCRLIVVPIDDVDLQIARGVELLHALRLFQHPQIVWLLTADLRHTEHCLYDHYLGAHARLRGSQPGAAAPADEAWSRSLARSALAKVIPPGARHRTTRVELKTLLTWEGFQHAQGEASPKPKTLQVLLNDGFPPGASNQSGMGDWLMAWLVGLDGLPGLDYSWREIQQFRDEPIAANRRNPDPHRARRLGLRIIRFLLDPQQTGEAEYVGPTDAPQLVRYRPRGSLKVSQDQGWYIGPSNQRIVVGGSVRVRWEDREDRSPEQPNPAYALLALALTEWPPQTNLGVAKAPESQRNVAPVDAPGLRYDIGAAFVWTRWTHAPRHALFYWPFAKYPTLQEFASWVEDWRAAAAGVRSAQNASDLLAYSWLAFQLKWARADDAFATPLNGPGLPNPPSAEQWIVLLQSLLSATPASGERPLKDFALRLPSWAAPEVGLPNDVQRRILDYCNESLQPAVWLELKQRLPVERRQQVANALWEAWEHAGSPDGLQPVEKEEEALLETAKTYFANSPWYNLDRTAAPAP